MSALIRTLHTAQHRRLTGAETAVVLRALTSSRGRDTALAVVTGHEDDAATLAAGLRPASAWIVTGPLDGDVIDRYTPALHQLHSAAAGTRADATLRTILGYLDWAEARSMTAAGRLTGTDPMDGLRAMIKLFIARGHDHPLVIRSGSAEQPPRSAMPSAELARSL